MTPIQQLMLGVGAKKKTYMEDVFSTFLYTGNATARSINNGINLAGEGGMVWLKHRASAEHHFITDTERGAGKEVATNTTSRWDSTNRLTSFGSSGFSLGNDNSFVNQNNNDFASYSFRKSPGFFDVVKYTGGSGTQTISHNLGCVPGMIWVKALDSSDNWAVFHRNMDATSPNNYAMKLNTTDARFTGAAWNVTATTFDAAFSLTNNDGADFIAYVFAGGESTAATARSVNFASGGGGNLDIASGSGNADFGYGTGDFTWEAYFNSSNMDSTGGNRYILNHRVWDGSSNTHHGSLYINAPSQTVSYTNNSSNTINGSFNIYKSQWYHVAVSRNSNTTRLFINGLLAGSVTDNHNYPSSQCQIATKNGSYNFEGNISNVRIIKGTGLYTSSFKPPTEPLTNITNTKLLCCQNSSVTGSTVIPSGLSINANSPSELTASTDSPFDDPAAFTFGDSGDQNVIKCGSYVGNGSNTGPEINIGWEPQWVLIKWTSSVSGNAEGWHLFDSMRGIVTGGTDTYFTINTESQDSTGSDGIDLTPTGFKVKSQYDFVNNNGTSYIYMCIRRPDGYVGKPPELGTDVFGLGTRSGSSSNALSNVNVFTDFSIIKRYNNSGEYWAANARLMGKYSLQTNSTDGQLTGALPTSGGIWDHMLGHLVAGNNGATNTGSDIIDYGWKRHAGFDVVCYEGNGTAGRQISHSMNKTVEMVWIKRRNSTREWIVGHKGLNGGTTPWEKFIQLNSTGEAYDQVTVFNDTAPSSLSFTIGSNGSVNGDGDDYIAMLFASTDVSKVGYYTGTGSDLTITLGFQPRFVLIKDADNAASWHLFDTLRGIAAGTDKVLLLNDTDAQTNTEDRLDLTSDGMTLHSMGSTNENNVNFIYYAHA